jgi:hypothetical protein
MPADALPPFPKGCTSALAVFCLTLIGPHGGGCKSDVCSGSDPVSHHLYLPAEQVGSRPGRLLPHFSERGSAAPAGRRTNSHRLYGLLEYLASIKWFREFENALRVGIPALRRMGIVMEIAAHPHEPGPFGEREVAAHRRTAHVAVEFGKLGAVDEVDAPLPLNMRATVQYVVRISVGVAAEPEVDRPRMRGQVAFKRLRLRLIVQEVKI